MRSIFVRIYMGMMLATICIAMLISVSTYYISKYRITAHMYQNYGGTFQLIGEGVARHQGEKRNQWLAAIEKLSDLKFLQYSLSNRPLNNQLLNKLKQDKFVFEVDKLLSTGEVYILLPDSNEYLQVRLSDFGSSLVRISAFLILNEIGRHKSQDRFIALEKLRTMFKYPIQLKKMEDLNISTVNLRAVQKGDISVVLSNSTTSTPTLMAYAPVGNSSYALALGSIPFFDWFPLPLILAQVLLILILMAATSFFLVRPLEKRLEFVDKQIDRIGHDKGLSMTTPLGSDAIGKLSNTVNSMAIRIHRLIDAQNDMIRAISHELRTPITRIRFRMAMIAGEDGEEFSGIERDLDVLEKLIDEVLTFSRLQRETPELFIESIQLDKLIHELTVSAKVVNPAIKLELPPPTECYVQADRRYLFRALENLLLNAQKYAVKKIVIGYSLTKEQQCIWIADDGSGIPEHERATIFDPFKRLDSSRDRQSGGYGLGLAIVKQVASWHKGKVEIDDSENGGAKMIFSWPRSLEAQDKLCVQINSAGTNE